MRGCENHPRATVDSCYQCGDIEAVNSPEVKLEHVRLFLESWDTSGSSRQLKEELLRIIKRENRPQ